MSETCTKCGAVHIGEKTCESIFGEFMALEFTDHGYGRVHFLTVACYMVQQEGYSDELYIWVQTALRRYLEVGHTTEMFRQDAAQGPGRTKGIFRSDDAESYCKLNEQCGHATLQEMGPLVSRR